MNIVRQLREKTRDATKGICDENRRISTNRF